MTNPDIFDPTFRGLQNDTLKPNSKARVTGFVSGFEYSCLLGSHTITATIAGKNLSSTISEATIIQTPSRWWIIDSAAGYPSRWARPLADFAGTNPAGVFLRYVMDGNPRYLTYGEATVVSLPDDYSAVCDCWDGQRRTMQAKYAGATAYTTAFSAGDTVLCYCPGAGGTDTSTPDGVWEIIGFLGGNAEIELAYMNQKFTDPSDPYVGVWELAFTITPDPLVPAPEITGTLAFSGTAQDGVDFIGETSFTIPAASTTYLMDVLTQVYPLVNDLPGDFTVTLSAVATPRVTIVGSPLSDNLPSFDVLANIGPSLSGTWAPGRSVELSAATDLALGDYLNAGVYLNQGIPWGQPRIKRTYSYSYRHGDGSDPEWPDISGSGSDYVDGWFLTHALVPYTMQLAGPPGYYLRAGTSLRLELE